LCSTFSDRRSGSSCWMLLDDGELMDVVAADVGHDDDSSNDDDDDDDDDDAVAVDDGACALATGEAVEPVDSPSLASFIGSCCLMGSELVDIDDFCSFLALIRFIGRGMLPLRLSRFSVEAPGSIPAVDGPPEMVLRRPRSTVVADGVGDEAVLMGGGGEAAPEGAELAELAEVSQSSAAADGVGEAMGAVETIVMLGLSRIPWPRRASSFW